LKRTTPIKTNTGLQYVDKSLKLTAEGKTFWNKTKTDYALSMVGNRAWRMLVAGLFNDVFQVRML
jgi:hypothetical protein